MNVPTNIKKHLEKSIQLLSDCNRLVDTSSLGHRNDLQLEREKKFTVCSVYTSTGFRSNEAPTKKKKVAKIKICVL